MLTHSKRVDPTIHCPAASAKADPAPAAAPVCPRVCKRRLSARASSPEFGPDVPCSTSAVAFRGVRAPPGEAAAQVLAAPGSGALARSGSRIGSRRPTQDGRMARSYAHRRRISEAHGSAADSALTCRDAVVVMRAVVRSDHLPIHARAEFRTDLLVARGLGGDVVGEGARCGAQPGSRRRHRQGFGELRWLDLAGARRRTYAAGPMPLSSMARRR